MWAFVLLILMCSPGFLLAGTGTINPVTTTVENSYTLDVPGLTWNKTTLNVIILTPGNVSWWNPAFVNSSLRAVGQWIDAIDYFAAHYSGFSFLSLKMSTNVSSIMLDGFDIYLSWTEFPTVDASREIGLQTWTSQDSVIVTSNISLATRTGHGQPLTDGDMQNIALHELGHSLGLGHSNYTGDTMYPVYTLLSPPRLISTLDVYGVASVFAWLNGSLNFYPVNAWLSSKEVTLPPYVPYVDLPVSPQNMVSQSFASNPVVEAFGLMLNLLIHPEIFTIAIVLVIVFLVIVFFPKRKVKAGS